MSFSVRRPASARAQINLTFFPRTDGLLDGSMFFEMSEANWGTNEWPGVFVPGPDPPSI